MSDATVTLQFTVLTRTDNWLKSSSRDRRDEITVWSRQPWSDSGATPQITDDKGAIVQFNGDDASLRRVREWAAAHSGSVRVLP